MRRMMMTTALGMLLAGPALAQSADAPQMGMDDEMFISAPTTGDIYGTDLIGKRLYASETEFGEDYIAAAGESAGWDDVGEIGDLVISQDGQVEAVLLDIGGFLGIGEKTVAVQMDDLNFLREDGLGGMFIAITGTRETLERAPEYIREDTMAGEAGVADPMAASAPDATGAGAPATSGALPATRPAMMVDGYKDMEPEALTSETLTGARVYSVADEDIGEVSELVLDESGKITDAVVDVGGFLGLGEKSVALTMDEVQIMHGEAGDVRVYVDATKETLESRPEYVE